MEHLHAASTRGMLDGLDGATSTRVLDELRAHLATHATPEGVLLAATGWLITARRP
ncbi:MAG TPA: hypothetical protein VMZ51_00285 [Acidimicrobiales bacterium]|nr:hypothetical protein [Acidimicrobiales bacterium]